MTTKFVNQNEYRAWLKKIILSFDSRDPNEPEVAAESCVCSVSTGKGGEKVITSHTHGTEFLVDETTPTEIYEHTFQEFNTKSYSRWREKATSLLERDIQQVRKELYGSSLPCNVS